MITVNVALIDRWITVTRYFFLLNIHEEKTSQMRITFSFGHSNDKEETTLKI